MVCDCAARISDMSRSRISKNEGKASSSAINVALFVLAISLSAYLFWTLRLRPGGTIAVEIRDVHHVPAAAGDLAGHNLLLITLDTTRADRLGCYGNRAIRTPNLDRLAAFGVFFTDVTAVSPTTMPSHASVMTGLYPSDHGVRANGLFPMGEQIETLAEVLQAAGYQTGAVVSAYVLDSQFGLAQGFDSYNDDFSEARATTDRYYLEYPATETTARALRWLEEVRDEPYFLWVHYFDPHPDYKPPAPFADTYVTNLYDGEIAYVDYALGTLLKQVDRARTLVTVVGDHGEGLGFHDEPTHGYLAYDSTMRVPWILYAENKLEGGLRCVRPVSQVDVAPLLLSLLGQEGMRPTELLDPAAAARPIYFEALNGALTYGWEPIYGVVVGKHKYIHGSKPELFDRSLDPHEKTNLFVAGDPKAETYHALVAKAFQNDLEQTPLPTVDLDSEKLKRLQALGYFADGVNSDVTSGAGAIPREVTSYLRRVELALHADKPPRDSIAELEAVIAEVPDFSPAWFALARIHEQAGNAEASEAAQMRDLQLRPNTVRTVYQLALLHSDHGRNEEALNLIEPVTRDYPGFVPARALAGAVLGRLGEYGKALDEFEAAFRLEPAHENVIRNMVFLGTKSGSTERVRRLFQAHLETHPDDEGVRIALTELTTTR